MTLASRVVACTLATLIALPSLARAQSAEAEVLFREGKRLMKDGQTAAACEKFDASARLEPSAGALLSGADCREKNKQLATAWAAFLRAVSVAKTAHDDKRAAEGQRRADALEKRLSYLTISVPDPIRDGLTVTRNQLPVDAALWNQPVPVDAGDYAIEATVAGRAPWRATVAIAREGQRETLEVKRPDAAAPDVAAHTAPPPDLTAHTAPPPDEAMHKPPDPIDRPPPQQPSRFTGTRKLAVVSAVVGLGGVAVGAVFGSKASKEKKDANAVCPQAACSDMDAVQKNKDAQSHALIANVGFIAGGALVATGVVLWFVGAPKADERGVAIAPVATPDQLGISLAGRF